MKNLYKYKATIINFVDGDTLDLNVDLGFKIQIKIRVRLLGVDTPEIYHPSCKAEYEHGVAATTYLKDNFLGKTGILTTHKDKKGKYGRYLATFITDGGVDLIQTIKDKHFEKRSRY